ncbi:hypothetical protein RJ641_028731 [Dillenia turbinata]|uniref:Uncharacterized protein n=1 Tax=Dillenia turbinata TaxID=194707 RepID=A0AAN8VS63_9MAGN
MIKESWPSIIFIRHASVYCNSLCQSSWPLKKSVEILTAARPSFLLVICNMLTGNIWPSYESVSCRELIATKIRATLECPKMAHQENNSARHWIYKKACVISFFFFIISLDSSLVPSI